MKFGKYLAARQLELPEYSPYFINYKQLKKLINALTQDNVSTLKAKNGSFFFRLERELEKVNQFYLEKESELRFRLDLLVEKKNKSMDHLISKKSITFISLYDGFKKFSKDLDRLEQFVELNETGFTKVLKKWDKRSKSRTKELYLTTTVNVQPIFHQNQIVELSDLVANNLMELESISDGDKSFIRYEAKNRKDDSDTCNCIENENTNPVVDNGSAENDDFGSSDQLYTDFYEITLQNANLPTKEQMLNLKEWSNQIISKLNVDTKKYTFSKVFMLLIRNLQIPDDSVLQFYEFFKEFIDLKFIDDINKRTCLIEVSTCQHSRNEVLQICLDSEVDPSIKDITGRTCLHYLTENGRDDMLVTILSFFKDKWNLSQIIDIQDNDSISPLLLAIINNHVSSVQILLDFGANGFPKQNVETPMYLPLNVACKFGNLEIVKLLLLQYGATESARKENLLTNSFQCNAEGLLPLHIVASSGNSDLVPLLLKYGADINQIDKLNKWSSIFYSVFSNDEKMTKTLIEYGADFTLKDEDGRNPLYYAIWEGNISVFNVLLESMRSHPFLNGKLSERNLSKSKIQVSSLTLSMNTNVDQFIDLNNLDTIPELSLPPPIIPLRKYGHNFLEKKIFLKLSFYTNRYSVKLNPNVFMASMPGRITISNNDLIPRNIMLPVLDNDKVVTFQLEGIDDETFGIDFELFPTFGTRLLAKATLTSSILKSEYPGLGMRNIGYLELPLLDVRLRTIGSLRFTYELIYPYSGKPLEISMHDTYWKLSSIDNENDKVKEKNEDCHLASFVTSSSLNGEYYGINVCLLHDGTPIVCPRAYIQPIEGVKLPISMFMFEQVRTMVYESEDHYLRTREKLQNITLDELKKEFNEIISHVYLPLEEFLAIINHQLPLNLDIFYPSIYELANCDLREFVYTSNKRINADDHNPMHSTNNLNYFVDSILNDIFNHVRYLRNNNISNSSRKLMISSNNPNVCTLFNWKQPNYPVFYNLNGIKYNRSDKLFYSCTANGISKGEKNDTNKSIGNYGEHTTNKISIDNIDSINKDSTEYINLLDYDDKLTRSIKAAINYVCANNLLGITVPERILSLCPEIVTSIRSKGLILVATKDCCDDSILSKHEYFPSSCEDINDLDEEIKHLEVASDIVPNGHRSNNVTTFSDSIDM